MLKHVSCEVVADDSKLSNRIVPLAESELKPRASLGPVPL